MAWTLVRNRPEMIDDRWIVAFIAPCEVCGNSSMWKAATTFTRGELVFLPTNCPACGEG